MASGQAGLQIAVLGTREYLDPIACVQRQTDAPDTRIRRRLAQVLLGQPQGQQTLVQRKRLLAAALQWQSLHPSRDGLTEHTDRARQKNGAEQPAAHQAAPGVQP